MFPRLKLASTWPGHSPNARFRQTTASSRLPSASSSVPRVGMIERLVAIHRNCPANHAHGQLVSGGLVAGHAQQVLGVGKANIDGQNLQTQRLNLGRSPCLKMFESADHESLNVSNLFLCYMASVSVLEGSRAGRRSVLRLLAPS